MVSSTIYLPDGQAFTVSPVFSGLFFKSHELNTHPHPFPAGWTVVLHTEDNMKDAQAGEEETITSESEDTIPTMPLDDAVEAVRHPGRPRPLSLRKSHIHSYTKPTLQNDSLFISSISSPPSAEFKPAASPSRQIAMMLYVSLYWYFSQPAPSSTLAVTNASKSTAEGGRPRGPWRINIKRDGVLRGRNLIPKLERMGLLSSLDSMVGTSNQDSAPEWAHMYVTKPMFWQLPSSLFLFTLQPTPKAGQTSIPGSPVTSRPESPVRNASPHTPHRHLSRERTPLSGPPSPLLPAVSYGLWTPTSVPGGPYQSTSHLPTYYPPPVLQYTFTNGVRHPVRPKPPRMGEVFYSRFIPSVGSYLSFRVASTSIHPVPFVGPWGPKAATNREDTHLTNLNDTDLLKSWMEKPRVSKFWGNFTSDFLTSGLSNRHSFPAIAMWDGVPFGYFEIYWVKEDILGRHLGSALTEGDYDRGMHVFIGEEWARGRSQAWITALVHWMFCEDYRTNGIWLEPRVDNERFIQLLERAGFTKVQEVTFPHKQSWAGRLRREVWDGPSQ